MANPSVVVITGAASGIGRHFAQELYQRGFTLALGDLREEELRLAFFPESDRLFLARLDVSRLDSWEAFLSKTIGAFGRIDYLFNVAGVITPGDVWAGDPSLIDFHIDINAKGLMYGTRLVSELMVGQGSGHIINISSLAGLAPVAGLALYSASKFAVRAYSIAAAYELRPKGVYVSVVCPDLVDTPMLDRQLHFEEAAMTFSGPRRPLRVEDISNALLRLMETRSIELALPAQRGWLAKIGNLFPARSYLLYQLLRQRGITRLREWKQLRGLQ